MVCHFFPPVGRVWFLLIIARLVFPHAERALGKELQWVCAMYRQFWVGKPLQVEKSKSELSAKKGPLYDKIFRNPQNE